MLIVFKPYKSIWVMLLLMITRTVSECTAGLASALR